MSCRYVVTAEEVDALDGVGMAARAVHSVLREQMDFRTGLVGKTTPISLFGIRRALRREITRGAGVQDVMPSEKEIRMALDALERKKIIQREGNESRLVFRMSMAYVGNVRPFQTGHGAGSNAGSLSDDRKANAGAAKGLMPASYSAGNAAPNRAHISEQRLLLSTPQAAGSTERVGHVDKSHAAVENLKPKTRQQKMQELLTAAGVRVNGSDKKLDLWVHNDFNDELIGKAISKAKATRERAGSRAAINLGLIHKILIEDFKGTRQQVEERGKALGISPRPGETWTEFKQRIGRAEQEAGAAAIIHSQTKPCTTPAPASPASSRAPRPMKRLPIDRLMLASQSVDRDD